MRQALAQHTRGCMKLDKEHVHVKMSPNSNLTAEPLTAVNLVLVCVCVCACLTPGGALRVACFRSGAGRDPNWPRVDPVRVQEREREKGEVIEES